jgi:hypothetical protein
MRRTAYSVIVACLLLLTAAQAHAERRVALVIGNGAYPSAPLKNPVNDAKDMAAALQRLGFDVMLLTNANQQQMDSSVREFGLKLRQGGAGLFYYAGHGLQVGGENYLVPVNANIQTESDVRFTCLPAGMVLGKMEDARNDLNIIILDACRNNPFARSFRSAEQGLAKMDAPTGSLISYATAPGSVASDGAGRNGLFTQHLLKNMATPGLSVEEMFKRVRQSVVADTNRKQVPWEASSLIGQFYFSSPVEVVASGQHAVLSPPMSPPPQLKLDPKTEKKRLAEDAAQLKREKLELAELHALQAEKDRLETERQKVTQGELLAMGGKPQQKPITASAVSAVSHAAQFAQLARAGLPKARGYFEHAVQSNPDDADARAGLAIALVYSGREADAKYQFQRLNDSGAQSQGVRLAKGLLLGLEGNADAAYQFNRAQEEGADRALVLLCQIQVAAKRGEYAAGQQLLAQYAALVPEPERAENVVGLTKSLDVESALVGKFLLDEGPKTSSTWNLVLDIYRQGSTLVGSGTLSAGKVRAFDFKFTDSKLTFWLEVERSKWLTNSSFYWRMVLDISKGLNSMQVLSVEVDLSKNGDWKPTGDWFGSGPRSFVRAGATQVK